MSKINLTNDQKLAVINQLLNDADRSGSIKKEDGYINKEAAKLLNWVYKIRPELAENGIPYIYGKPYTKAFQDYYGIDIEKAASDYTGALNEFATTTDFRGTGFMAEQAAENFWNFVINVGDPFLKRIGFITSKKNPMPVNLNAMMEENLISSIRSSDGQPGTNLKKQVARFRKNMLARHIEMQFDLQYEDIVNNLDDPNFERNVLESVMIGFSNDILRLFTNGTSYDYSGVTLSTSYTRDDMYKLLQGWCYKLQNGCGTFTADNVTIYLGAHGKKMTANKYAIQSTGTVSKWAPTIADTSEFVVPADSDATLTAAANKLKVAKGTTGTICYARKDGIEVIPNKNAVLTFTVDNEDATANSYAEIFDNTGNLLASSPAEGGSSAATYSVNFFTGNTRWVYVKLHQTTNSKYSEYYDITLKQVVSAYDGFVIQEILDTLIKLRPVEYNGLNGYAFIMGKTDIEAYAESKGQAIQITPLGQYVSGNNTVREQWRVNGIIPNHRGHEVLFNPYMHSISEAKTYGGTSMYGMIIFGIPTDLLAFGLTGNFPFQPLSTREFKARGKNGGPEIEYTKHAWTDTELAPNGRFCIAYQGAKCETPVLMKSDDPKSEPCVSGTTTAASGCYAYCDTQGARIFATLSSNVSDIATIELAIAGVTAGDVYELTEGKVFKTSNGLTAAPWSFAAFKDGVLLRSSTKACTFV